MGGVGGVTFTGWANVSEEVSFDISRVIAVARYPVKVEG